MRDSAEKKKALGRLACEYAQSNVGSPQSITKV